MKRWFVLLFLFASALLYALDYADASLWVSRETEITPDKPADVFFLCPTTSMAAADNMDVTDEAERARFARAVKMEQGLYSDKARFFAPYYRQKTLPHYGSRAAHETAYADAKDAFLYYLKHDNQGRPFILAGFSQGSELTLQLIKEVLADPEIARRMVVAYLIGWCVTEQDVARHPHLRPAQGELDTGVFVAWNTEEKGIETSFLVPRGVRAYAINPLNWRTDDTPAAAALNHGARFTLHALDAPVQPQFCGAVIDPRRGTLNPLFKAASDAPTTALIFGKGVYHVYDYIFFYENLRRNVGKRIEAFNARR